MIKSNYMNLFKNGKLYQWDKFKTIVIITPTTINEEFCLDKTNMDLFLKFENPEITKGKTLKVQSGFLKATLQLSEYDFEEPKLEFPIALDIDSSDIKAACSFCDKDEKGKEAKPILKGVNISNGGIWATNVYSAFCGKCDTKDASITIPFELASLIASVKGPVQIATNNRQIACKINDSLYIGTLIEGNYPEMAKLAKNISNPAYKITSIKKSELKSVMDFSLSDKDIVTLSNGTIKLSGTVEVENTIDINLDCTIKTEVSKIRPCIDSYAEEDLLMRYICDTKPVFISSENSSNITLFTCIKEGA